MKNLDRVRDSYDCVQVMLARSGGISRHKTWFVYVVGVVIVAESVLTNVVMFHAFPW
jgi:uncharacterized membrane protein YecN with MAPEG domain